MDAERALPRPSRASGRLLDRLSRSFFSKICNWLSAGVDHNQQFKVLEEPMTNTEDFDKAWKKAFREKDFSLVDEIYHVDHSAFDNFVGVKVNLDADKTGVLTYFETVFVSPQSTLAESEEFVEVHRYHKFKDEEILFRSQPRLDLKMGKLLSKIVFLRTLTTTLAKAKTGTGKLTSD